jgi:hypothetical protein
MSSLTTLEPWQPRVVAKLVQAGCPEDRARRIASDIERQTPLFGEDYTLLMSVLAPLPIAGIEP